MKSTYCRKTSIGRRTIHYRDILAGIFPISLVLRERRCGGRAPCSELDLRHDRKVLQSFIVRGPLFRHRVSRDQRTVYGRQNRK